GAVTQAGSGYTTIVLTSAGGLVDGTATEQADLTVDNLVLRTATGIGATGDVNLAVKNIAFQNTGGAVNIQNTGVLNVAALDGITTVTNTGTTTTITTASPLNFNVNTTTDRKST